LITIGRKSFLQIVLILFTIITYSFMLMQKKSRNRYCNLFEKQDKSKVSLVFPILLTKQHSLWDLIQGRFSQFVPIKSCLPLALTFHSIFLLDLSNELQR